MIAPWWKLLLARLFGEKVIGADGGHWVIAYKWRGTVYVTAKRLSEDT